jgi:2-polyprenyl-3-methyl-5-hydroxy-6-metoxy-1,4-benzoquinol methylase
MSFSIEQAAREYIPRRFPRASHLEQEKYILDWKHKVKVSKAVVRDFAQRVGDPAGKKVLDAGCGNGGISSKYCDRFGYNDCGSSYGSKDADQNQSGCE